MHQALENLKITARKQNLVSFQYQKKNFRFIEKFFTKLLNFQSLCFNDIQKHCKFKAGSDESYENLDFYDLNDTFDFDDLSELPEDRI